nr:VTT domain-containing protein [Acetobacter persici]
MGAHGVSGGGFRLVCVWPATAGSGVCRRAGLWRDRRHGNDYPASTAGCVAGFFWARWGGRQWAQARLGARFARLDAMLSRQPFLSILTLRLLPVGSALLLNLLGGVSGIGVLPFAAATVLGGLPQNVVAVLLGAGVRLDAVWQFVLGGGLFVASGVLGVWLLRRAQVGRIVQDSGQTGQSDA